MIFLLQEGQAHEGGKAQRVAFCHKGECLISTGFSRMSERQFSLWKVNLGVSKRNMLCILFCAI